MVKAFGGGEPFFHKVTGDLDHGFEARPFELSTLDWLLRPHSRPALQGAGKILGDRDALALLGDVRPLGGSEAENRTYDEEAERSGVSQIEDVVPRKFGKVDCDLFQGLVGCFESGVINEARPLWQKRNSDSRLEKTASTKLSGLESIS